MVKLNKIEASTLIESIVAMVIITLVFAVALTILSNITGRSNPQLKFKAYTEAQNIINIGSDPEKLQDHEWQKEGLFIERRVLPYYAYDNLYIIEVTITGNTGKVLIRMRKLIRIDK